MAINNALGQDGGTGTKVLRSNGGAVAPTFEDVGTAAVSFITGSTFSTLQESINVLGSAGQESGGVISDAGGETFDVAAGTGLIRATNSDTAELIMFDWPAVSGTAIPTDTARYVGIEYNSGTPQVVVKTSYSWNLDTEFPLGNVVNDATTLHFENAPHKVSEGVGKLIERVFETLPDARDARTGGLILGESGTRNFTLSAGALWDRITKFSISALDTSSSGSFDIYFRDGSGGFTEVASATQWPNTKYDDNSGVLATISNNRWAVLWFYLELDGGVTMQYGRNQYTSEAAAEAEAVPATAPDRIIVQSTLLGRFVFQESAATVESIESVYDTSFQGALVTNHNNLSSLQGGTTNEFYHLTAAESVAVVTSAPTDSGTATATANALSVLGGTGLTTAGATTVVTVNLDSPVLVANGGTGATTLTGVLTGNGTSAVTVSALTEFGVLVGDSANAVASTAVGTATEVLTSNGAGVAPTFQAPTVGDVTAGSNITANSVVIGDDGAKGVKLSTMFVSDAGEMTNASQPCFAVSLSATVLSATGDGTGYLILFDNEIWDQNSDFNASTGIFTAPVTGKYMMSGTVSVTQLTTSYTDYLIQLDMSNNTNQQAVRFDPGQIVQSGGVNLSFARIVDMDAADTLNLNVAVSGSTKDIDIQGGNGFRYTCLTGALIC
ncbi:MAG: hypothetical protein K1000chlam2_00002 [Chlamydiae bacterium]|nr:hypothetical protein [Chlamydiota bacterium]